MKSFAPALIVLSATIVLVLGLIHLLYTFRGSKLHPRDAALAARMNEVALAITRETTIWRAWIGFNASHSYGAILYGVVYGYLALVHARFLFESTTLLAIGALLLAGYMFLAKRYWFSVPFRGLVLATLAYLAALVLNAL